jgi:hypothetical protein
MKSARIGCRLFVAQLEALGQHVTLQEAAA